MASPSLEDACYHVDVIKKIIHEDMGTLSLGLSNRSGWVGFMFGLKLNGLKTP